MNRSALCKEVFPLFFIPSHIKVLIFPVAGSFAIVNQSPLDFPGILFINSAPLYINSFLLKNLV